MKFILFRFKQRVSQKTCHLMEVNGPCQGKWKINKLLVMVQLRCPLTQIIATAKSTKSPDDL